MPAGLKPWCVRGVLCGGLLWVCLAMPAWAQGMRLLVQRAQVAGFAYHAGGNLWAQLREGDSVLLVREPDNSHDPQAVRIDYAGSGQEGTLGYLARTENGAVARALDRGQMLKARISRLRNSPNPRNRVEIEIWATMTSGPRGQH